MPMGTPLWAHFEETGAFDTASGRPSSVHYAIFTRQTPLIGCRTQGSALFAALFLLCGFALAVFRLQDQHGGNNSNNCEQSAHRARPHKTRA